MDETSMVERVAHAIARAALDEGDGTFDVYALTEEVYDGYLSQGRAAIRALLWPTQDVRHAIWNRLEKSAGAGLLLSGHIRGDGHADVIMRDIVKAALSQAIGNKESGDDR